MISWTPGKLALQLRGPQRQPGGVSLVGPHSWDSLEIFFSLRKHRAAKAAMYARAAATLLCGEWIQHPRPNELCARGEVSTLPSQGGGLGLRTSRDSLAIAAFPATRFFTRISERAMASRMLQTSRRPCCIAIGAFEAAPALPKRDENFT